MGEIEITIIIIKKIVVVVKTTAIEREQTATELKIAATTQTTDMVKTSIAIKTTIMMEIITWTEIVTMMRTALAVAKTFKIFRKRIIIMAEKEIATMTAGVLKKGGIASFNKGEKYIWINSNNIAFA